MQNVDIHRSSSSSESDNQWISVVLKQVDVLSSQLIEQHRRLQQEVYVRLNARSSLLNYAIVTTGGITGMVSFLFPKGSPSEVLSQQHIASFALISIVCFTAAFVYLFFYMNFLSHSGYIYAASRQITEDLPKVLSDIQNICNGVCKKCSIPDDVFQHINSSNIFGWERNITEVRRKVHFTDSKFEIIGFSLMSLISFLLSMTSFLVFVGLLVYRSGVIAMVTAVATGGVFIVFIFLYAAAFLRCRSTYDNVMSFRDREFPQAQ